METSNTRSTTEIQMEINHDMRNLLTNISSLSVLLVQSLHERNLNETHELAKMIRTLSQESMHLMLNNNHIQQSKKEYGIKRRINATNLLHDRCLWLYEKSAFSKHVQFSFSLKNTALYLDLNETNFYRIFDNLVSNAIKFTPPSGKISFMCKRMKNALCVTVKDSGIGIPAHFEPYIFEEGLKTRRRGTNNELSTGIGLMVVKKLVTENGGKIWFDSEENKGTTFYVTLPLAP